MECHLIVGIIVDALDDIYLSVLVPEGQLRALYGRYPVRKANYIWPSAISQQPG